jgi:hypothetical protein
MFLTIGTVHPVHTATTFDVNNTILKCTALAHMATKRIFSDASFVLLASLMLAKLAAPGQRQTVPPT